MPIDLEVEYYSIDDGSTPEFPQAAPDNDLAQAWNIKTLSFLYAVNSQTQQVIPIAHGLTSMDEMENRMIVLTKGM